MPSRAQRIARNLQASNVNLDLSTPIGYFDKKPDEMSRWIVETCKRIQSGFDKLREATVPPAAPTGRFIMEWGLVEPLAVEDDAGVHLEATIYDDELLIPKQLFVNLKTFDAAADLTGMVQYSADIATADPASRTWADLLPADFSLTATYDQIVPPVTIFVSPTPALAMGTKFRVNVTGAAGDIAIITLVSEIVKARL